MSALSSGVLTDQVDGARAPEGLYYIQNKGYCGNCLLWWRTGGGGYTLNLDEALKVTEEKARQICRSRPHEDIPHSVAFIDALAHRHVNCETLRDASERERGKASTIESTPEKSAEI